MKYKPMSRCSLKLWPQSQQDSEMSVICSISFKKVAAKTEVLKVGSCKYSTIVEAFAKETKKPRDDFLLALPSIFSQNLGLQLESHV